MQVDIAKALSNDFKLFLCLIWKHLKLPKPTEIQYRIADFLQHGPDRMIIEGYRGVGKSWITSAFVLWLLKNDPNLKIEVVSASQARSIDFSTFTQRLIYEIPALRSLIPPNTKGSRVSRINFDVGGARAAHAPSVKSVGITGQITGTRANVIIADDIEVPNNSSTQEAREKLLASVGEFNAILSPGGRIIYLGTPQTEESVYNVLGERNFIRRMYPVMYPSVEKIPFYMGCLDPIIEERVLEDNSISGKPTDPERFNSLEIEERRVAYGNSDFTLQFMLDTSLSDADKYPLKTSDLVVVPITNTDAPTYTAWGSNKECIIDDIPRIGFNGDKWLRPFKVSDTWAKYETSVMRIDPSGKGSDETAVVVVKSLHGALFLTEAEGFVDGYSDKTLEGIAIIARDQQVELIDVESNFGMGMFAKLLEPWLVKYGVRARVVESNSHTNKEQRIIGILEPIMNQHKLIVSEALVRKDLKKLNINNSNFKKDLEYSLFYQLTRITKEKGSLKHDDKVDALAGAVDALKAYVSRDMYTEHVNLEDDRVMSEINRLCEEVGIKVNRDETFMDEYMKGFNK